jgi:hypothetical protein
VRGGEPDQTHGQSSLQMKTSVLRAIAHNVADSLASGVGWLIGMYQMDVFDEASRSRDGVVTVDFLAGKATRGDVSLKLADAIRKYREVLPEFCAKHGASVQDFAELSVDYYGVAKRRVVVTVKDPGGHRSVDEYVGWPLKRIKFMDRLGRIRTRRRK